MQQHNLILAGYDLCRRPLRYSHDPFLFGLNFKLLDYEADMDAKRRFTAPLIPTLLLHSNIIINRYPDIAYVPLESEIVLSSNG